MFVLLFQDGSNLEFGSIAKGEISSTDNISETISFSKTHSDPPKTIILSYSTFGYFYGELHVEINSETKNGFKCRYIPIEIGNGKGQLVIYWAAFW